MSPRIAKHERLEMAFSWHDNWSPEMPEALIDPFAGDSTLSDKEAVKVLRTRLSALRLTSGRLIADYDLIASALALAIEERDSLRSENARLKEDLAEIAAGVDLLRATVESCPRPPKPADPASQARNLGQAVALTCGTQKKIDYKDPRWNPGMSFGLKRI